MKINIWVPWKNLGCLGLRVNDFYFDIFLNPYPGFFLNTGKKKYRGKFWKIWEVL